LIASLLIHFSNCELENTKTTFSGYYYHLSVFKVLKQWMLNATVYILVIACFIGEEKQKTQTKDISSVIQKGQCTYRDNCR
jgi:hypothetical protein